MTQGCAVGLQHINICMPEFVSISGIFQISIKVWRVCTCRDPRSPLIAMFGSARTVNGCPRMFPVIDQTLKSEILAEVRSKDGSRAPRAMRSGDLNRVRETSLLAINVVGRQGHVLLTRCGDRAITFVVFAKGAAEVYVLPIQFASHRHESGGTLVKCSFAPRERLLVLNEVCDVKSPGSSFVSRINDLHVLVHADHKPDPYLFPLRVVARRFGNVDQISELQRLVKSGAFRTHSISVFTTRDRVTYLEHRVFADSLDGYDRATPRSPSHANVEREGSTAVAHVVRVSGDEEYRVSTDDGATWQDLCVRTMVESKHLERIFQGLPVDQEIRSVVANIEGSWRFLGPCA